MHELSNVVPRYFPSWCLQVDLTTRRLEYVFALHEAPINTILLSAGFAVTGSDDRKASYKHQPHNTNADPFD